MPVGEDLVRVHALTLNPDFIDYYGVKGPIGNTYKPSAVSERGWMYRTEAVAAEGTGDVLLHEKKRPIDLIRNTPSPLSVSAHNGNADGIVFITPGICDGVQNTITVTLAIDGGGDLTAVTSAADADVKTETVAADLAAQVVAGVTIKQDADLNDVIFTPDSGVLTKFEVALSSTP